MVSLILMDLVQYFVSDGVLILKTKQTHGVLELKEHFDPLSHFCHNRFVAVPGSQVPLGAVLDDIANPFHLPSTAHVIQTQHMV